MKVVSLTIHFVTRRVLLKHCSVDRFRSQDDCVSVCSSQLPWELFTKILVIS
jgi:hypothetical protein